MEGTESEKVAITHLAIGIDSQVTHHVVAMKKSKGTSKCVFSGIQPTGIPHIGNYCGAIKQWVGLQENYRNILYSIVDLHAITVDHNPQILRQNVLDMTASLVACGISPEKSVLFQQSKVPQHAELAWILGTLTTLSKLQQLPQWKEKTVGNKEVGLGIFTYPVLQAADILLYRATDVPVGDDQLKHIELARYLASKFNNKYKTDFFPQPQSIISDFKRIKSLKNPSNKMSKSDASNKGRIELTDSADEIRNKIRKAVTDHMSSISYDPDNRPGVSNLVEIYSGVCDQFPEDIVESAMLMDTAEFKETVADAVVEVVNPIREEILRLKQDVDYLEKVLDDGADKAKDIAETNLNQVKKLVGLS